MVNSKLTDEILGKFKLKAFEDDIIDLTPIEICVFKGRKHCGKEGNAGYRKLF